MSDRIEAKVSHEYSFPPERVYECWLRPEVIRQWMASALQTMKLPGEIGVIEVDARVGGKFCFSDKRPSGEAFHWGTYKVLDFPNRIAFTWNAGGERLTSDDQQSLVTIVLTPTPSGCQATLTHSMDAQWRDYLERTENGWRNMLVHIAALLSN